VPAEVVKLQTPKVVLARQVGEGHAVRVVSARDTERPEGVKMMFIVRDGDHLYHLPLVFTSESHLCSWVDEEVVMAIQAYRAKQAKKPVNVVYHAMDGTFADQRARAEAIVTDLVHAGHLPQEALEDF
jgi:hypothetical protein